MATINICAPPFYAWRTIQHCSVCQRNRRFVVTEYEWYDARIQCCGCGDSWSGGYRCERPFRPGWRKEAITEARREYEAAGSKRGRGKWWRQVLEEHRVARYTQDGEGK